MLRWRSASIARVTHPSKVKKGNKARLVLLSRAVFLTSSCGIVNYAVLFEESTGMEVAVATTLAQKNVTFTAGAKLSVFVV